MRLDAIEDPAEAELEDGRVVARPRRRCREQLEEQRQYDHRRWMLRSVALTFSIVLNRVWLVAYVLLVTPFLVLQRHLCCSKVALLQSVWCRATLLQPPTAPASPPRHTSTVSPLPARGHRWKPGPAGGTLVGMPALTLRLVARRHVDLHRVNSALCRAGR